MEYLISGGRLFGAQSIGCAEDRLYELGLEWDIIRVDVMRSLNWKGQVVEQRGVHMYFMKGDSDIAYYTPLMGTLHVNEAPRPWHQSLLAKTIIIGRNVP